MCCLQIYFYVFCVRIKSRSYLFIWICYNYTCAELLIILKEFHVSLNLHFSAKLFSVFIWMPNRSLLIIFWLKLWTKWWLNSAKNRKKETFFSTCFRFSTYNSWTAWSLLFIVFSRNVTRSITQGHTTTYWSHFGLWWFEVLKNCILLRFQHFHIISWKVSENSHFKLIQSNCWGVWGRTDVQSSQNQTTNWTGLKI